MQWWLTDPLSFCHQRKGQKWFVLFDVLWKIFHHEIHIPLLYCGVVTDSLVPPSFEYRFSYGPKFLNRMSKEVLYLTSKPGMKEVVLPSVIFPFSSDCMQLMIDMDRANERVLECLPSGGELVTRKLKNWHLFGFLHKYKISIFCQAPWKLLCLNWTCLTNDENVHSVVLWIPTLPSHPNLFPWMKHVYLTI